MSTPFGRIDEQAVRALARLAEELGLSELEVQDGDLRVRIARAAVTSISKPAATVAPTPASAAAATASTATPTPQGTVIRAPMAGTFYRAPAPGQPVFVDVGSAVAADSVVCIIESMKMMNRIEAERAGVVSAVLLPNGARVQVGQPLFTLAD